MHTVIASDQTGAPLRVVCGYCRSEHNYRGGPRVATSSGPARAEASASHGRPEGLRYGSQTADAPPARSSSADREPFPIVSDRERTSPAMTAGDVDFEMLLRRVIREESGITPVAPAAKWRGGSLVLRPGNGTQDKTWPVETFFHKVVMIRNRLRTLEQQVNAAELPDDVKIKLQGYISGCYGSLTSFNVLFADEEDQFKGSAE
jgi:hypothetical protein